MASLIASCKVKGCKNYVMPVPSDTVEPRGLCSTHWHLYESRKAMDKRTQRNKEILKKHGYKKGT